MGARWPGVSQLVWLKAGSVVPCRTKPQPAYLLALAEFLSLLCYMAESAAKTQPSKAPAVATHAAASQSSAYAPAEFTDNRPAAVAQRQQQAQMNHSPRVQQAAASQAMIGQSPRMQQAAQLRAAATPAPVRRQEAPAPVRQNNTGLPDELKAGVENLSGHSLDDVQVHYNSAKPAQLQAHAYAQGSEIHVAPGQEQHLPHEAWHVVQQKQGRVRPTRQLKGVGVNDDSGLEREADVMGGKAVGFARTAAENNSGIKESGSQLRQGMSVTQTKTKRHHAGRTNQFVGLRNLSGITLQASSNTVQLRGENPHANPGTTGDWSRTDHHIISHSKLVLGLGALDEKDKLDVLIASVPDVLTVAMMENVKVNLSHKDTADESRELEVIQRLLVDPEFKGEIRGQKVADIRNSFFEWMGGNQFAGPNTSIRAEPSPDKDAIDTDGQYFTNANYEKLEGEGKKLYAELDRDEAKDPLQIKNTLMEITKIAKNVSAAAFDPSQWVEVTNLDVLDKLAKAKEVRRAHMRKYAYFKVVKPSGKATFAPPFDSLKTTNEGGSEFEYGGKKVPGTVGGALAFFSLAAAQVSAPSNEQVMVRQLLAELELNTVPNGGTVTLAPAKGKWRKISKQGAPFLKFDGKGLANKTFPMLNETTISEAILDETIDRALPAITLENYLKANGAPITSWLPKQLYDKVRDL